MAAQWGDGDAYERLMGRWSRRLAPLFVNWARLPAGGSVLDVGCGTGSLSAALAGAGMRRVVGIDRSLAYVAYAAATVGRASGAEFEVGDAAQLPRRDGEFDAAASSLMLNFVPDPLAVMTEMRRVVRDGGVVAACVWDYAEGMGLTRRFWDAAIALDLPEAWALDEGRRFAVCRPGPLQKILEDAGLEGVEVGAIDLSMTFRDFEDYWTPLLGAQGPVGGYMTGLSEPDRQRLREHLEGTLPRNSDGSISLLCRAWAARGVRPA